ncbi:MAG: complex I subunit 5 family protein [Desulfobulbaceae bacterium]|nr:complex I subunit 5 family protein [Desulfobulbaceae bacterium]
MIAHFARDMMNFMVLSLVAGVPLLLLAFCCFASLRQTGFRLLPWSPLPALLAVLFLSPDVEVQVGWFFMGGSMGLDAIGRIFLGITAAVWLLASLSVHEKFRHDPHRFRFAGFFLAAMSGNFGLILARDILGFYLFFALMSFSAYGLIAHNRPEDSARAGRVYLILVFFSELAMFTAMVILSARGDVSSVGAVPAGEFSMLLIILLFVAFGVKIGALPFQSWMALSYQQAPVPAATALAGAMVNAGILGWLRFFPFGQIVLPGGGVFFIIMGTLAALYGVLFGLYQDRPGRVLAASSISQMGLLTAIAGFGLLSSEGGSAALILVTLFAVHHSLAKTSLFLGYDLVDRGGRPAGFVLVAGLLLPCLALAGFPFTGGAMVKASLKELAALGGGAWYLFGKVFLPVSSIATTVLMLHFTRLLRQQNSEQTESKKTVATLLWILSVAGVIAVPWVLPQLRDTGSHSLQAHALVQSMWPVVLGALLALVWFAAGRRLPGRNRAVPGFDILSRTLYDGFMHMLKSVTDLLAAMCHKTGSQTFRQPSFLNFITRGAGKWEKVLGRWSVVYLFYLLISIILFMIMLTSRFFPGGA